MTEEMEQDLLKVIKDFLLFPRAQMCKHHAAISVLSVMLEYGYVDKGLLSSLCKNSEGDETALEILGREIR